MRLQPTPEQPTDYRIPETRPQSVRDDPFSFLSGQSGTWIVILLAVAASITGIRNGFSFDDVAVIANDDALHHFGNWWHAFVQPYYHPPGGGALYRPLVSLGFAIQWAVGGGTSFVFHGVSIALYAAISFAVLRLARRFFDEKTACIAGCFFAVHPVHVEAVANVVGQAELGAALFVVLGVTMYLDWSRSGRLTFGRIAALCAMYASGMMFKEHAVVFPALLIGLELLVAQRATIGMTQRLKGMWPLIASLALVSIAFVFARTMIIGQLTGREQASVLVGQGFVARLTTMLPIVLEWVRLFIWPASLLADYSPSPVDGFSFSMIPALAVVVALCAAPLWLRRRYPSEAYASFWVLVTLLIPSNLIVITGFVLAERTLFLPSVGVALLLGSAVALMQKKASAFPPLLVEALVICAIVAGMLRSSYHNPVWKDNLTLFGQTAEDAPMNWKAHFLFGGSLIAKGKTADGILEMNLAVRLVPKTDPEVRYLVAHNLYRAKLCGPALPIFRELMALVPANGGVREEAAECLAQNGKIAEAVAIAAEGLRLSPGDVRLIAFLNSADRNRATASNVTVPH
jgi:protein O-mannosyl-transferase